MLFDWTKQDKMCKFSRKSSISKLHTALKQKNKQSIHSAYVSLMLGCWRKEKGTRLISEKFTCLLHMSVLSTCMHSSMPHYKIFIKEQKKKNDHTLLIQFSLEK